MKQTIKAAFVFLLLSSTVVFAVDANVKPAASADSSKESPLSNAQIIAVQQICANYLKQNPMVIKEAIQSLNDMEEKQEKQAQLSVLQKNQDRLFNDNSDPIGGNQQGSISIVAFLDYRCGFCKRLHKTISAITAKFPQIKFIYKELPVLGEASELMAKIGLIAQTQGKYKEIHDAFMNLPQDKMSREEILAVAHALKVDTKVLDNKDQLASFEGRLRENIKLARELGIEGTPALVLKDTLLPGYMDEGEFEEALKEAGLIGATPSAVAVSNVSANTEAAKNPATPPVATPHAPTAPAQPQAPTSATTASVVSNADAEMNDVAENDLNVAPSIQES